MKKTYLKPETISCLIHMQQMIAASVEGFDATLDDDNTIGTEDMLSRRHNNVWEDEELAEEEEY